MIYFALRSSDHYLAKLAQARSAPSDHHLVAIAGDLSFLHGIGAYTRSITVVDTDRNVLQYCTMVARLVQTAHSLHHFIELITGHRAALSTAGLQLGEPVELQSFLRTALGEPELLGCYQRTIGAMTIDPRRTRGTLGQSTILFQGVDRTPLTFSWRFGEGSFTDEASFSVLQRSVRTAAISFRQEKLEQFDLSALAPSLPVCFLASNHDSPLFTSGDVTYRAVAARCAAPTRYISWHRDTVLIPHRPTGTRDDGGGKSGGCENGAPELPVERDLTIADLPERGLTMLAPRLVPDRIELRAVAPGSDAPVRYVSLTQDCTPLTPESAVMTTSPNELVPGGSPGWSAQSHAVPCYSSAEELAESGIFGGRLLAVCLDELEQAAEGEPGELLERIYRAATPCFFELLILGSERCSTMIRRATAAQFMASYFLVAQGRYGRRNYLLLRLQGLSIEL